MGYAMKRIATACLLLALLLPLGGCGDSPEDTSSQSAIEDSRVVDEDNQTSPDLPDEVAYICENKDGEEVIELLADFSAEPLLLRIEDSTFKLDRVESASGSRYETDGIVFWIKGSEAMLTMRGSDFHCSTATD
ncbi:hypothetical protein E8L03_06700 [Oceanidesulfovibrio marinus]|uniref:C-type lysozyme inhibitor domain-containing protein n=2 Tax=Oceanidesulfovibrio marinus TaxID=370038 RepID=A0ABX6NEA1_9BACT|nr:hypothetical protein E8L03_06700 [Oceanidesulfovibrio marinus]